MEKLNILLIEGSARQVLPMSKSLRKLGHIITTYNSSKLDYGYTSKYPHRKVLTRIDWNKPDIVYRDFLKHIKESKYDLIIPMNDDAAILLSRHKKETEKYAKVAVNDWEIFQLSMDKYKTMSVCMDNSIPCPLSVIDLEEFEKRKEQFKFPIVVKPRTGCGAVGFHISYDYNDLKTYYQHAVKKYGPCLIQEFIPQNDLQYKAELYIDRDGNLKSAIVFAKLRWYPVDGGSSTLNVTVDRPDIVESCSILLKKIGWKGYADIDLIQDPRDNIAKIIEINPRITGSVKICFKAGVNFSQQIIEDFLCQNVTEMMRYKKDVYLRYIQKDILWFIKSPDRFSSKPSWFNFSKTTDQIFDIQDPLPFVLSSFDAVPKLIKDIRRRKIQSN